MNFCAFCLCLFGRQLVFEILEHFPYLINYAPRQVLRLRKLSEIEKLVLCNSAL